MAQLVSSVFRWTPADVNAQNAEGFSTLMTAVLRRQKSIAEVLIQAGLNVDAVN